jgi:hypothetical protein
MELGFEAVISIQRGAGIRNPKDGELCCIKEMSKDLGGGGCHGVESAINVQGSNAEAAWWNIVRPSKVVVVG